MVRCSLLEFNETHEESDRESFLLKIFLGQSPGILYFHPGKLWQQLRFTGRSEAIAFLESIHLVHDEQSKCLHIVLVYGSTALIKTTTLYWNKIALRVDEVHWSILNEIVSVFWSSHKLFAAFLLCSVALVVHLQVVLRRWVNYGILVVLGKTMSI